MIKSVQFKIGDKSEIAFEMNEDVAVHDSVVVVRDLSLDSEIRIPFDLIDKVIAVFEELPSLLQRWYESFDTHDGIELAFDLRKYHSNLKLRISNEVSWAFMEVKAESRINDAEHLESSVMISVLEDSSSCGVTDLCSALRSIKSIVD